MSNFALISYCFINHQNIKFSVWHRWPWWREVVYSSYCCSSLHVHSCWNEGRLGNVWLQIFLKVKTCVPYWSIYVVFLSGVYGLMLVLYTFLSIFRDYDCEKNNAFVIGPFIIRGLQLYVMVDLHWNNIKYTEQKCWWYYSNNIKNAGKISGNIIPLWL